MDDLTNSEATWTHPAVQRRTSGIEGDGLFAREDLPPGTVVARLHGHIVDDVTLRRLFVEAEAEGGYVDTIMLDDDQNLVLAPDQPIHYCNHSCDPTLWHVEATTVATRRAVAAGEELTIDYATQTTHPDFEMTCNCGTELCRGMVTGVDWTDPDWQRLYGDHVVPAVRRAIQRWGS
jgi:uncharacterized protein